MNTLTDQELKLTNSDKVAIVDRCDFKRLEKYAWRITNYGYVVTGNPKRGTFRFLHHLVVGRTLGLDADHRDRNKLNNRRNNLRIATRSQNEANKGLRRDSTTKLKGVSFFKRDGTFRAQIGFDGRKMHIGYFDTPKQAAIAYDAEATKLFGEFALTNSSLNTIK